MKKLKKLIAVLSSALICGLSVTPILSNGINQDLKYYFSDDGYLYVTGDNIANVDYELVYRCESSPELTEYFGENPPFYMATNPNQNGNYNFYFLQYGSLFKAAYGPGRYKLESASDAKKLYEYLSSNYPDIQMFAETKDQDRQPLTDLAQIDEYFAENSYILLYLEYGSDITGKEKVEIMFDIYNNTGLRIYRLQPNSPSPSTALSAGDADLDGNVTISDAAQIMSFVTNYEKYPLSEMSQIVGDVYNTGDGINNMDALQIQRMLANLE